MGPAISRLQVLAAAVLALVLLGFASPLGATGMGHAPALDLDAGADSDGPDPLAPADAAGPAPQAPGAPASVSLATPGEGADPVVAAARQALRDAPPRIHKDDLAALVDFYAGVSQPVFVDATGLTARGRLASEEIARADDWGLKASAFDLPPAPVQGASPESLAQAEVKLAAAVLTYARHARGGRFEPVAISRLFDQKPTIFDPRSLLRAAAANDALDAYLRDLHPRHAGFHTLRKALLAARAAKADDAGDDKPPARRDDLRRILVNMERWRWLPADLGEFYVWDSVTEQMTTVFEAGKPVLTERIVVGKPSSPTVMFSADMQFVIFHPSWGVPPGMKAHELGPKLRNTGGGWFSSNPAASQVLAAHGLKVSRGGVPVDPDSIDWSKANVAGFDFTQAPGPRNVLGIVKFRFPNKHDIYMHDTPERHLFGGAVRAFSHGCMRVQNPVRLAEVILAYDKGYDAARTAEFVKRGGEIKLTKRVPVHITYFTAIADEEGKVRHLADLYGLDGRVASALEGQSVRISGVAAPAAAAAEERAEPRKKSERVVRKKAAPKEASLGDVFSSLIGN
ncbi:MAG: L,D-transpeptidase family protein [Hyphomicrobiaceae bacterium]|nr:L,D-transpeptidase family protein [Hyphomicrobiaceae bacterium]